MQQDLLNEFLLAFVKIICRCQLRSESKSEIQLEKS